MGATQFDKTNECKAFILRINELNIHQNAKNDLKSAFNFMLGVFQDILNEMYKLKEAYKVKVSRMERKAQPTVEQLSDRLDAVALSNGGDPESERLRQGNRELREDIAALRQDCKHLRLDIVHQREENQYLKRQAETTCKRCPALKEECEQNKKTIEKLEIKIKELYNRKNYVERQLGELRVKNQSDDIQTRVAHYIKMRIKPGKEYTEEAARFFHKLLTKVQISLRKVKPICNFVMEAFAGVNLDELGIKLDRGTIQRLHLGVYATNEKFLHEALQQADDINLYFDESCRHGATKFAILVSFYDKAAEAPWFGLLKFTQLENKTAAEMANVLFDVAIVEAGIDPRKILRCVCDNTNSNSGELGGAVALFREKLFHHANINNSLLHNFQLPNFANAYSTSGNYISPIARAERLLK